MMPDASVSMTRRRGTAMQALSRAFPFPVTLLNKARWGKDGGPGGITGTPFHRKGWAPCAPAATEGGRKAVPVATKEATGIDSRDKGVSFPPEERFSANTPQSA